jgi:predicted peptidase
VEKAPLVVWLHGGVWNTRDNLSRTELDKSPFIDRQDQGDSYVLVPLARRRHSWVSPRVGPKTGSHPLRGWPPSLKLASRVIDHVLAEEQHRIDRARVVVSGGSMGGYGAWELAQRLPGRVEAVVPISGGGDPSRAGNLNDTRVWAFHGACDTVVHPNTSREMFAALLAARGVSPASGRVQRKLLSKGTDDEALEAVLRPLPLESWKEVRYTEFTRGGHDAPARAMRDPRLYRWMLGLARKDAAGRDLCS